MAVNYEKEYHAILKACSDNGISDTEDVALSDVVRGALSQLRAAAPATDKRPTLRDLVYQLVWNVSTGTCRICGGVGNHADVTCCANVFQALGQLETQLAEALAPSPDKKGQETNTDTRRGTTGDPQSSRTASKNEVA